MTTWMELEGIMLSEISQKKILYDLNYMWNLIKNLIERTRWWLPEEESEE